MSNIEPNEVKISIYSDDSIDLEFGNAVPAEHEELMVKSFEQKDYFETSNDNLNKTCVSTSVWVYDTLKKGNDELPYWHPKVMAEQRAKLRAQERASRTAAAAPKPKPPVDPSTLGDGTGRKYVNIPDLPKTPKVPNKLGKNEEKEKEVAKFYANGQWKIEKSNYGPKKAGQYTEADNARRKSNNVETIDNLGNMGRVKEYGHSNPKIIDLESRRIRKLNRKQPVKTFSQEEIAEMNAKGMYGAGKKVAKTAEELMPNQLANLLLNKSILGSTPPRQPTDEEMFGRFAVSEEQAKVAEDRWHNAINSWFDDVRKPVENQDLSKSWGSRGPISKEALTEEEERIRNIAVDPELLK